MRIGVLGVHQECNRFSPAPTLPWLRDDAAVDRAPNCQVPWAAPRLRP